jgi:peptide/nickel transport system permease protein
MRVARALAWTALALVTAVAICPDFFATYSPTRQYRDFPYASPGSYQGGSLKWFVSGEPYRVLGVIPASHRLLASADPGRVFVLGSDEFGRDWYSRLCYAASISLLVAPFAALVSVALGAALGLAAGYRGGWLDRLVMRASDVFLVLPWFYVVVALRAALPLTISGPAGLMVVFSVLAALGSATPARLFRGQVLSLRNREYVLAGRALGAGTGRIFRAHVLPFLLPTIRTQFFLTVPAFIVTEVTLSFLGLGIAEPTPTWGGMLAPLREYVVLTSYPWMFAPAVVIVVVCLALQIVARE